MRLKVNIYIFCLRIIIKPYQFVMLLEAEDNDLLQVKFCLFLSWPLLSQDINVKAYFTVICNLEHGNHCFLSAEC